MPVGFQKSAWASDLGDDVSGCSMITDPSLRVLYLILRRLVSWLILPGSKSPSVNRGAMGDVTERSTLDACRCRKL
jgi:hypothetical protein